MNMYPSQVSPPRTPEHLLIAYPVPINANLIQTTRTLFCVAEKPHAPLWVAARGGGVEVTRRGWWGWRGCGGRSVVRVAAVAAACDDEVMVMFDEEMWWCGDGWRGDAAGGRIWWLVVSPKKCGGAKKTGRKMRERMRENMGARFYDENDSNPNI
ncbi:hypothetical protein Tco_0835179 [Tanacetum coccineum]